MSLLATGLVIALAVILTMGAVSTIRDPSRLRALLREVGIAPRLALLAATSEIAIACVIVWAPSIGAILGVIYLSLITAWLAVVKVRGTYVEDCGCFRKPHAVDGLFFARNGALIGGFAVVAITRPDLPMALQVLVTVAVLSVVAAALNRGNRSEDSTRVDRSTAP